MTQVAWAIIGLMVLAMGVGGCMSLIAGGLIDIGYMVEDAFWRHTTRLLSPPYRSFEEYQADAVLQETLDSLGRDYKTLRGITVVMPYREAAEIYTEA